MDFRREFESMQNQLNEIAQVSKIGAELSLKKAKLRAAFWRTAFFVLLAVTIISNAVWIAYSSQFEKVVETTETTTITYEDVVADADYGSDINFAGGDVINGGKS